MDPGYLKQNWQELTSGYEEPKEDLLEEILEEYSHPSRHYHNLGHIQALLELTEAYYSQLSDPLRVQLCIWYHDVVYNVHRKDNELKSADFAKEHLSQLRIAPSVITYVYEVIVATKAHVLPPQWDNFDTRFMLDIDLSVLAADQSRYVEYTHQIRKEYRAYPNFLYKRGRRKVLTHLLERERIFQTDMFFEKWEQRARDNMERELKML